MGMGYSEFDRALLGAWHRVHRQLKDDPAKLDAILRRRGMTTYIKPLRSWSLVLRANDKRIEDNNSMGLVRMDGGCGRLVYKLFLPMPWWTMERVFGQEAGGEQVGDPGAQVPGTRFLCLRCAGLVYESAELGSTPGRRKDGSRRRVDVLDRLVKRHSGGVLRGRDVFTDS